MIFDLLGGVLQEGKHVRAQVNITEIKRFIICAERETI
jgi:hypothetical protein